jgi:glutamine synthetase
MPDPATKVRVEFGDGSPPEHFYLCDVVNTDCTPWDCCPRNFLKRALAALEQETGLHLLGALEQEFVYSGAEANTAGAYSLGSVRRHGEFGAAFLHALRMVGVDVDSYMPEFGVQQYEVTYRPSDPVRAADCALVVREIARATAHRLGHKATFAPMVSTAGVGSGVHIHLSLWDKAGRPVTYDARAPYGLSAVAGQFVAGIIAHMPALCAVTAPSVVSYLRLTPHRWSAAYNNLGYRDREAAVRIAPIFETPGADPAAQYNFENRAADATATLSGVGAAGASGYGIRRKRRPAGNRGRPSPEPRNAAVLPRPAAASLGEALDALEGRRYGAAGFAAALRGYSGTSAGSWTTRQAA